MLQPAATIWLGALLAAGSDLAPDGSLDRVEFSDALQRFGGDRRGGGLMHLVELAPRMRPARR